MLTKEVCLTAKKSRQILEPRKKLELVPSTRGRVSQILLDIHSFIHLRSTHVYGPVLNSRTAETEGQLAHTPVCTARCQKWGQGVEQVATGS